MDKRGLNDDGTIAREGALDQVPVVFGPVVEAARTRITETFATRLHSAYLYGSIPRGTAIPGASDLDLLTVLHDAATDADRRTLSRSVGRRLVRTGFTLIMPRWGGWTSDLNASAELFGRYYPD